MGAKLLKIIGWVLFLGGVFIIGWTLLSSYNIFTNKADLPGIFKVEEGVVEEKKDILDMQAMMEEMISGQMGEFLPADATMKLFNLIAWSMLAFILIFGGSQIAGLGIKVIKK